MASLAGQKRKVDYNPPTTPAQARKRQKSKDARSIPTQTADAALSNTGELNIASFIKSREFEIAALESSMKRARKNLSARAFQQVPRHMRRRTASHNVKKIPRRLRGRATREMIEDNTPTGSARRKKPSAKVRLRLESAKRLKQLNEKRKNIRQKKREAKQNADKADPEKHVSISRVPKIKKDKLADPPKATSKYKRRQVNKTWLPTHLWHTKRAHMTRPTLPLWKMAIALTPNEKTYRATHRATSWRGCVAWDMSYMSTVGCQGTDTALEGMLKALGFAGESWSGAKYRRWKSGTRHSESWVHETGHEKRLISPITVIWQIQVSKDEGQVDKMEIDGPLASQSSSSTKKTRPRLDRKLFIRVHPSAFHQFWAALLKAAKIQRPQVLVEDLRFEIGSVDVKGPGATEAIVGILKLAGNRPDMKRLWSMIPALNDPSSLPQGATLAFDTLDPRLNHPPRQIPVACDEQNMNELNEFIVSWSLDNDMPQSNLFDQRARYLAAKFLPSQKSINRRRRALLPGQHLEQAESDPPIPVLLLAHRGPATDGGNHGSWTILLPWSCVDSVWRSFMYYPLTSGSTPRFGGLEQVRQVAFERSVPWFPADFPGTEAGKAWDRTESEKRFDTWLRRPTSKRFAWDALDLGFGRRGELGRGWACDWEYLFMDAVAPSVDQGSSTTRRDDYAADQAQSLLLTQRQRKNAAVRAERGAETHAQNGDEPAKEAENDQQQLRNTFTYSHLSPLQALSVLKSSASSSTPAEHTLATIRVRLLTKGTPKEAARIYRLPIKAAERSQNATKLATEGPQPGIPSSEPGSASAQETFSPALFPNSSTNNPAIVNNVALRQRWLDLDPQPAIQNPNSTTSLSRPLTKEHRDRVGDVSTPRAYDSKYTKDLSRIRVFPPHETKPQVLNIFGPKPPPLTEEQKLRVLQPQPVPHVAVNSDGDLVEERLWDKHVPCPGPEDLIGFVTTAGYNLNEGRGTAIGSLWVQRVVEGWRQENSSTQTASTGTNAPVLNNQKPALAGQRLTKEETERIKKEQQQQKQTDRERHLCVVRNAGESVGRLGIWELC